jgi:hypothetical protein
MPGIYAREGSLCGMWAPRRHAGRFFGCMHVDESLRVAYAIMKEQ